MGTTSSILPPTLAAIEAVRGGVMAHAANSPLMRFDQGKPGVEIFLKLENLQWPGAFKIRPAAALMQSLTEAERARGVWAASSGNWGIAVAELAARLGVTAAVVVPDNAPESKLLRLRQSGARLHRVSPAAWWQTILSGTCDAATGTYLDAVTDWRAQAGSGTIGLEILEQLPDVDTVLVPFGGGGLVCGIASAMKAVKPRIRIIACESELATPLRNAFRAGKPVEAPCRAGFISGVGAPAVLPSMWPLLQELVDDTAVAAIADVVTAVRDLALRCHVVAEGAGAVSVAAAGTGTIPGRRIVCIVSGGNIGAGELATVLAGGMPDGND